MIANVDYHLTDICNLNCIGCNNFCPLTKSSTKNKSMEQIKADLYLLSKFKDNIEQISLSGGEPTLHENLSEILKVAREIFPTTRLKVVSNGVLINKILSLKDVFIENNIILIVTVYPFKENYKNHYKIFEEEFPSDLLEMWDFTVEDKKQFHTKQLANRVVNTYENTLECPLRVCTQLRNGKIYLCGIAANVDNLLNKFDYLNIKNDTNGYVDLNTCTAEELDDFVNNKSSEICLYCKIPNYGVVFEYWERSKHNLDEWVDMEF